MTADADVGAGLPVVETGDADIVQLGRADLNLLVHLQVLIQERSVTRAAARLDLTPSAVSHSLSRCRKLVGDELLIKVGTSLEATPRARALLAPLTRVLREINTEVLTPPGFAPETSTRRFRIGMTSTTSSVVLPPMLARLSTRAPHVTIQTGPLPSRYDLLDEPDVDVILLPDGLPTSLSRERLYDDRWVAVVAYGTEVGERITEDDLRRLPHVVFDAGGRRTLPYSIMGSLGIDVEVQAQMRDFVTIPMVVAETGAMAIIQERVARKFEAAGLLRVFELPVAVPRLGIDMVWNPRFADDPACLWLREQLVECAALMQPLQ